MKQWTRLQIKKKQDAVVFQEPQVYSWKWLRNHSEFASNLRTECVPISSAHHSAVATTDVEVFVALELTVHLAVDARETPAVRAAVAHRRALHSWSQTTLRRRRTKGRIPVLPVYWVLVINKDYNGILQTRAQRFGTCAASSGGTSERSNRSSGSPRSTCQLLAIISHRLYQNSPEVLVRIWSTLILIEHTVARHARAAPESVTALKVEVHTASLFIVNLW